MRATRRCTPRCALPGSKSLTNRALVLAALARTPSTLVAPLRQPRHRADGRRAARAGRHGRGRRPDSWQVDAGTAARAGRGRRRQRRHGDALPAAGRRARRRRRPLRRRPAARTSGRSAPMVDALRDLGADVTATADRLPLTVHGRGWLLGGSVDPRRLAVVAVRLRAAARRRRGAPTRVEVRHEGGRLPSRPHIEMTVEMLRAARRRSSSTSTTTPGGSSPARCTVGRLQIEPDLSNAAPFLAAAVVTGGRVTVPDWPLRTTQAGDALRGLLRRVRRPRRARRRRPDRHRTGPGRRASTSTSATSASSRRCSPRSPRSPSGPSRLRGIAHLRHHETDRLAALATEITALGGDVARDRRTGSRSGRARCTAASFTTYDDHRLATAAAVLGLCVPGVEVEDVATTAKTLPGFAELWTGMLGVSGPAAAAAATWTRTTSGSARAAGPGRGPRTGRPTRTPRAASWSPSTAGAAPAGSTATR